MSSNDEEEDHFWSDEDDDHLSDDDEEDSTEKTHLKTGSQSSLRSLGMSSPLQTKSSDSDDSTLAQRLTPEGGSPARESLYDCIAYVIHCPTHETIAISKSEKAVWLPFVAYPPSKTWRDASNDGILIILSKEDPELDKKLQQKPPIHSMTLTHTHRVQLPITEKFIFCLIQYVRLEKSDGFKCCVNTKRIQWIKRSDILAENIAKVWGPEVKQYGGLAHKVKPILSIREHSLDNALFYVPKDPPQNLEEELLRSLGITKKEVEILYADFLEHCFPSVYMTLDSYKDYMTKYGYETNDTRFPSLFNAFSYNKKSFLDFHELLLGLASMEPNARHNEGRVRFVFRYYDTDSDGFLNEVEFKALVKDMSPNDNENGLQIKVRDGQKIIGTKNNKISFQDFSKAIGKLEFRGTSILCKSAKPILTQISKSMVNRTDLRTTAKLNEGFLKIYRRNKGICNACKGKKYDYGLHSVRLDTNGRCVEPRRIFEPEPIIEQEMNDQKYSMEFVFNTRSIANVFLDMIKDFHPKKGSSKDIMGLMSAIKGSSKDTIGFLSAVDEREVLHKYLQILCSDLENIFTSEERVIKINSPVYIVGDIYGNLDDLLKMETKLWHSFPIISANYVFLGNYIDEGKWGIECIIYLFSLKLIAPKKIFLLRGNHEVREVENTFQKECIQKYGEKWGTKVWEIINRVFDKMPLSVIIDESIFCTHGGVPNTNKTVIDFLDIESDLKDPQKDSAIAWELLCNEPMTQSSATSSQTEGFIPNKKRGTGYLFTEVAVNKFLQLNGLTHIICANEVTPNGYGFHFNGKLLTVFSSSRFCGNNNESAAVFVDEEKIRIIRLETTNTTPATDRS